MYNPDDIRTGNMPALRDTDLSFEGQDSLTQQQFAAETDVNNIVRSHGFMPADPSQLRYADVSEIGTFDEALAIVRKAESSFSALPAEVRARFENNPSNMIAFLQDERNYSEAVEMGLSPVTPPTSSQDEKPFALAPEAPIN